MKVKSLIFLKAPAVLSDLEILKYICLFIKLIDSSRQVLTQPFKKLYHSKFDIRFLPAKTVYSENII